MKTQDVISKASSFMQLLLLSLALFFMLSWLQERDANAELHETLAALDAECGPVIEMSWPVELGAIQS